ncbi:MAG: PxxKW family cysteine-rich protein [Syntrophobacterales bacterium]|nr:PxxKW family cysteine-rich protein [Syntrophobacterales bacterium]
MLCQTVKVGVECSFMTKGGCSFTDGTCRVIIENCAGCNKIVDYSGGQYCKSYADPASRWIMGKCALASHVTRDAKENVQKINPLKASKRASKGKSKKK